MTVSLKSVGDRANDFVRLAITSARFREEGEDGETFAREVYGEKSLAARVYAKGGLTALAETKAAVAAGSTVSGSWAELLADAETAETAFFAYVRERTLLGRVAGMRRVPLNIRLLRMATGVASEWVGEGAAVPLGSATFAEGTLPARKIASLAVVTNELLKAPGAQAEAILRDDMARSIGEAIDLTFLDPDNAGVARVKPASITNDATTIPTTGDDVEDMKALIASFEGNLENAVLAAHPERLADLALDYPMSFPSLGARGGSAAGLPAFATKAAGTNVVLFDPTQIAMGFGGVDIRTAAHGSIEMESEPTQDSTDATGAEMVSLWQTNSTALMATSTINWEVARPHVRMIGDAS